jgi:hypothetical protein
MLVVNNMTTLLKDQDLKQVVAKCSLSGILNLEEKDSALIRLKIAEKFTKQNEKSRYRFILGQLYEELGKKDSNLQVRVRHRHEPKIRRKYVIQAS